MDERVEKTGASAWLWMIGGGVVILLSAVLTAYFLFAYAFPQGKAQYTAHFKDLLEEKLKQESGGTPPIPPDRLALLKEVGTCAERRDTSLPAVVLLVNVAEDALHDRQVTDEEMKNMRLVRDFVNAEGRAMGYAEMGVFLESHPEIKTITDRHAPPPVKTKNKK